MINNIALHRQRGSHYHAVSAHNALTVTVAPGRALFQQIVWIIDGATFELPADTPSAQP